MIVEICINILSYSPDTGNFYLLPFFFLLSVLLELIYFIELFKEPAFGLMNFLYCFSHSMSLNSVIGFPCFCCFEFVFLALISSFLKLAFPGGSVLKNIPAMQETQVQSLDGEDPLEEEMATHPSILAWRIP